MKCKNTSNLLFATESIFYFLCAVAFAYLGFFCSLCEKAVNYIYISFILISFGYLYALEFVFKKLDNVAHYKMLSKYYKPCIAPKQEFKKKRRLWGVIILWVLFLSAIAVLKRMKLLSWYVFLIGACIIFILNSLFTRKKCYLSVFVLHNKNDCCKNCGINNWDYAIFSSALAFAPRLSIASDIINWTIIAVSFALLAIWEILYHKYPERFYPETNQTLKCENCIKKCELTK